MWAHLSRRCTSQMDDEAIEVVGEVDLREFRLRCSQSDSLDEEAVAFLLMVKGKYTMLAL